MGLESGVSIFSPVFIREKLKMHIEDDAPLSYCYFVSDGNFVKIGKSQSPSERLINLQTGNCNHLYLIYVLPCKTDYDADLCETELHEIYREYHVVGEWFDILSKISPREFCLYCDSLKEYF